MACHELAALRLGLMKIIGIDDEAEKQHELKELGEAIHCNGPIKSLTDANTLNDLNALYQASLSDLHDKLAHMDNSDDKLSYTRALSILTKKVEQDLANLTGQLNQLYLDLDEVHHYTHEIYPA